MLLAVVVPALALLLTVLMAAPAWAVTVNVRVQGLNGEVCAPIQVNVPENLTVTDSHGAVINCGPANPLGALYMAAQAEGFPFVTEGGGAFLNSIAGVGGPPDWSSWWLYAVNGCIPMVGMLDWELREGDRILFFEAGGDPMAPWVDKELVVVGPKTAPAGTPVTLTVVGDDLGKANSPADALRFDLDPATDVELPAAFAPVSGATVHVGAVTYVSDAQGRVTIPSLPVGTQAVWAEKTYDEDWQYITGPGGLTITGEFADVTSAHPNYDAIHAIAGAGIVEGYKNSPGDLTPNFGPSDNLFRAQFAKMLSLALSLEIVSGAATPFTDLGDRTTGNPYPHDYVAAAFSKGIIRGLTASTFGTYEQVTRAQVVTMVVRAAEMIAPSALTQAPASFTATWGAFSPDHQDNARIAEFNGLLNGLPLDGAAADPWAPMTRAETAQIIANLATLIK